MAGIYVTKGTTLTLKNISFRILPDGTFESSPVTVHLRFDACPTWIGIAKKHMESAQIAKAARALAWSGSDNVAQAKSLESEFEASMQAIVAAATSLEAFYAILKEHVPLPADVLEKWRNGRTARYSQVSEVARRVFAIKPSNAKNLRANLKDIYRYRDMAVHPAGKDAAPAFHPELKLGMEWRFVAFRAANAEAVVCMAANILWQLAHVAKSTDAKLTEYQHSLAAQLKAVFPAGVPTPTEPAPSSGA
jgi:hypothetical protein